MKIPDQATFAAWNAGQIGTDQLIEVEAFFADMVAGADALGPRYSLAAMGLRAEHNAASSMLSRRREPAPYSLGIGTTDATIRMHD